MKNSDYLNRIKAFQNYHYSAIQYAIERYIYKHYRCSHDGRVTAARNLLSELENGYSLSYAFKCLKNELWYCRKVAYVGYRYSFTAYTSLNNVGYEFKGFYPLKNKAMISPTLLQHDIVESLDKADIFTRIHNMSITPVYDTGK
jgi:hypothetical protein